MLVEFPVFALNEDYMKALAITIQNKIDQVKNIIEEKQQMLIMPEPLAMEPMSVDSSSTQDDKQVNSRSKASVPLFISCSSLPAFIGNS